MRSLGGTKLRRVDLSWDGFRITRRLTLRHPLPSPRSRLMLVTVVDSTLDLVIKVTRRGYFSLMELWLLLRNPQERRLSTVGSIYGSKGCAHLGIPDRIGYNRRSTQKHMFGSFSLPLMILSATLVVSLHFEVLLM